MYTYKPYHERHVHTEILWHCTVPLREPESELFRTTHKIFRKPVKHIRPPNSEVYLEFDLQGWYPCASHARETFEKAPTE